MVVDVGFGVVTAACGDREDEHGDEDGRAVVHGVASRGCPTARTWTTRGSPPPKMRSEPDVDGGRELDDHLVGGGVDGDCGDAVEALRGEVVCGERLRSRRVELTLAGRPEQCLVEGVGSGLGGLVGGAGVVAAGGEPAPQVERDRAEEQHDEHHAERPDRDRSAVTRRGVAVSWRCLSPPEARGSRRSAPSCVAVHVNEPTVPTNGHVDGRDVDGDGRRHACTLGTTRRRAATVSAPGGQPVVRRPPGRRWRAPAAAPVVGVGGVRVDRRGVLGRSAWRRSVVRAIAARA